MDQIFGYIERITFQNSENGYSVIQIQEPGKKELTCVVGILPSVRPGESVKFTGTWSNHLIHGKQFNAKEYQVQMPADITGITKYLGSGLIKGIGPSFAKKIVDHCGVDTLQIIDTNPDLLLNIHGLGPKKLDQIKTCWSDQKIVREVMVFLQGHGVSTSYAQKIYKTYGQKSIEIVQENPYQLARDITGIGFKSADKIAEQLGISKDSDGRIDAGIEYTLTELTNDGHVCYPKDELAKVASEALEIDQERVKERMEAIHQQGVIEIHEFIFEGSLRPYVWKKVLYIAEMGIARELIRLKRQGSNLRGIDTSKAIAWVQEKLEIHLAQNQIEAVEQSLKEKVQIITGGPGTGKSTITNAILTISKKLTSQILLVAPTGRAAKRMTEITGMKAKTIHSLLEFDFKKMGFRRDRNNPLECDLLIVDEASMIDCMLMYQLLRAIPSHARVIFVGDVDQLPSVGPGNVLRDIIESKIVSVTLLTEIFRQAAGSKIITNAHKINHGIFPDTRNSGESDFFFINCETPEEVLNNIVALITQRLPKKYGFDPMDDIQVLSPMRKGIIGANNLNIVLQEKLNARKSYLYKLGTKFQVGDKVMQIRNNYDKDVYNGDVGKITSIDEVNQEVIIELDKREIHYEYDELDEVVLAYAVSIHKYQGSECPCVIIPVHTTHFKLLHRNLLYTGVTRGKKLVILVGTKKALAIAVRNDEVKKRYTGLGHALINIMTPESRFCLQH